MTGCTNTYNSICNCAKSAQCASNLVLSILDALRSGEPIFWHCSTLTVAVLMVLLLLAGKRRK